MRSEQKIINSLGTNGIFRGTNDMGTYCYPGEDDLYSIGKSPEGGMGFAYCHM